MSSKKDAVGSGKTAPDLEIVGDQVKLHPSGFIGGSDSQGDDGITERNLVQHITLNSLGPGTPTLLYLEFVTTIPEVR